MIYPTLTVAVATYRRPAELNRLLESVSAAAGRLPASIGVQCVVVDNDPGGSAADACRDCSKLEILYVLEPRPGISAARNAAVAVSLESEFIVFVDDDEYVSEGWLEELIFIQQRCDADMVAGPVYSVLPSATSRLVVQSDLFVRPARSSGASISEAGTGNLMCRTSLFGSRDPGEWFKHPFGLTGGEDAELTRRFHAEGARIIWAENAIAWEPVAAERATLGWLARRFRRVGAVDFRLASQGRWKRTRGLVSGLARVAIGLPPLIGYLILRGRIHGPSFRRVFRGIGYVEASTFGGREEYRRGQ